MVSSISPQRDISFRITDEQVAGLLAIMTEFDALNTSEGYVESFIEALHAGENYVGVNTMSFHEFRKRPDGVSVTIEKNLISRDVTGAFLSNDRENKRWTAADIAAANRRLEVIFDEFQ